MKQNGNLNGDDNDTDSETRGKSDDKNVDDDNEGTPTSSRDKASSMKKTTSSLEKMPSTHDEK